MYRRGLRYANAYYAIEHHLTFIIIIGIKGNQGRWPGQWFACGRGRVLSLSHLRFFLPFFASLVVIPVISFL